MIELLNIYEFRMYFHFASDRNFTEKIEIYIIETESDAVIVSGTAAFVTPLGDSQNFLSHWMNNAPLCESIRTLLGSLKNNLTTEDFNPFDEDIDLSKLFSVVSFKVVS